MDKNEHWLYEPHHAVVQKWHELPTTTITSNIDYKLTPVYPEYVTSFLEFQSSVCSIQAGNPLICHLYEFGSYMAFILWHDGEVIGILRYRLYHEFDPSYRTLLQAFGCIHPEYRSTGLGTRLITTGASYLIEQPQIDAIGCEVHVNNKASIKLLLKSGFVLYDQKDETRIYFFSHQMEKG